jgi:hypothetical protein
VTDGRCQGCALWAVVKVEQEFVQKAARSAEHTGYNFLGVELLERV